MKELQMILKLNSKDLDSLYKYFAGFGKVKVTGLGTFWVHRVPARTIKNNFTGGEIIQTKPAIRIKFKAKAKLKRYIQAK